MQPSARAWSGEYGCSARTYSRQCCALTRTPSALGLLRVALWSCVCSVVVNVMSYVGLRQHSRVSKRNDTCRNKWRRWCAGRGRELEPGAALYLCGPAIAQQKRHRPMWAPVRGARCYRLCAHSLVRQSEAAKVGIRRSTVPPRHGCSAPRLHMRARRKLCVGWQKGRRAPEIS